MRSHSTLRPFLGLLAVTLTLLLGGCYRPFDQQPSPTATPHPAVVATETPLPTKVPPVSTITPVATPLTTPQPTISVHLPQVADGADLLPPTATVQPTPTPGQFISEIPVDTLEKLFVQADGESLSLDDKPYVFVGVNATYLTQPYFPENQLEPVLTYLAETGGVNAVRLFFEPGHEITRLKQVLDIGGRLGIRFIVTLQDYYFDKSQHWFAEQYVTEDIPHVTTTVMTFRDRPEILAWELMNEPGCGPENGSQDCADFMYEWARSMSGLIKELDPNHLISVGSAHRMWTEAEQTNYDRMHALETIDLVTIHRDATDQDKTEEIALAHRLNKPVFIGEVYYWAYDKGCHPRYDGVFEDRAQAIKLDLERSLAGGVDGYLLWQHDPGAVTMEDGRIQWFCGQHSFLEGDPVYVVMSAFRERQNPNMPSTP